MVINATRNDRAVEASRRNESSDSEDSTSSLDSQALQTYTLNSENFDEENPPSFGNVAVTNSKDIHFGNKTFYQGPVTIKQILYSGKPDETIGKLAVKDVVCDGIVNDAFVLEAARNLAQIGKENNHKETEQRTQLNNQRQEKDLGETWPRKLRRKHALVVTGVAVICVLVVVIFSVLIAKYIFTGNGGVIGGNVIRDTNEQDIGTPVDSPVDPDVNLSLSGKLKIISRLEWVAQPPSEPAKPLKLPAPYVIIMHTATESCQDQAGCTFHVRFIQTYHIESRHWWDIGYNFLVGGDGFVYEGRGWKSEGAHTYGYNARSIGIAFIGTFNTEKPPERQIAAAKQLIERGVELGILAADYKILAAKQLQSTQSPGQALYEDMKTWDHWAPKP